MTILSPCTLRIPRHRFSRIAMVSLFLLAVTPIIRAQQQFDLDTLASEMASAISNSSRGPFKETKVLVIDFEDNSQNATELGAKLADAFSDFLRKNARGFVLMDRAEYLRSFAADKLDPQSYESPETIKCYADHLRATVVVDGNMEILSDKVVLWVKALQTQDKQSIFDKRISLLLTPEMQSLISADNVNAGTQPVGQHGYSYPKCVYCPMAEFSPAASKAKIQGTVTLALVIDPTGVPISVKVLRGLPCGLNNQAIAAAKKWRFKPAADPKGDPVAVRLIEMTFHLY
jgi:TonB family protein